jgi:hypothetical protein
MVVVVGVFLGLQASNWNEARLARVDEAVLIERFVSDLEAIEVEANLKAEFIGENQGRIEEVAALVQSDAAASDSDALKTEVGRIVAMPGTIERSPTYLELLTGGMRRITDDDLREAIVKHDGMLLDAKETQAIRRAYMESYVARLHRLRLLLDEVEPARAIELSGGALEIRLALMRLHEIYNSERSKLRDVLKSTQQLLGMLVDD